MRKKTKVLIMFVLVHLIMITSIVVFLVYDAYPREEITFHNFMKTEQFSKALFHGLTMAFLISLCLYGMWIKGLSTEHISWKRMFGLVGLSIAFLLFESLLADFILNFHIYPHH